ncbi:hypothetical protein PDIG_31390 [Penicillium digitatum PHI26]|uniref:Uncharacterized protein n=3 Tax=Penicillium digitatum TaxID=36651 RepID=K9GNC0_PEND2|nr:hypothetical protein PDIP_50970 [Penicillium digitatum Pd1]EKV12912.1 hypothetical protein PDIP_50970 [Penicillium digitatum Pd1]EKV14686.1 hypothetical protein PDIG_31390 [Penicillium digitatum PHI26]
MAEASLAFPMICLTFSFLFVFAVYNASIMRHFGAFYRRTILPVYRQMARKLISRHPTNQNLPIRRPEVGYEAINLVANDEDEQYPPSLATSSIPAPGYRRHVEDRDLNTVKKFPPMDSEIKVDYLSISTTYAGSPYRPRRFAEMANFPTHSQSSSPSGSVVSSDEYDSDWSNTAFEEAVFEPHNPVDEIPIWGFELERPMYTLGHEQGGPVAWLDEIVEWTSQGVFAFVSPDIIEQRV